MTSNFVQSRCQSYILIAVLIFNFSISVNCMNEGESNPLQGSNLVSMQWPGIIHPMEETVIRRFIRSPFLPPLVTAFNPNKRSEKQTNKQVEHVGISGDSLTHPIAISQAILSKTPPSYKSVVLPNHVKNNRYSESYIPIATIEEGNHPEAHHLSFMLQNDQSLLTETTKSTQAKLSSGALKTEKKNGNDKQLQFSDLNSVLKAINKTSSELKKILKGSFSDFLDFVEEGATKEEILDLLDESKVDKNVKFLNQKKYKNSATDSKIYKKSRGLNTPHKEPVAQNFYKKSRNTFGKDYEPDRLPRDSPLVIHLSESQPEKKKSKEKEAQITSMSIDEVKEKQKSKKTSKYNLHALSKLSSDKENSNGPLPHMYVDQNSEKNNEMPDGPPSTYQQLKLVFPVKGILLFCGILGCIALVTIVILIIYGSVKCSKQKPISNNYQVTERIELTNAQCQ